MEFESPRFIGEPTLLEILNDPNTGTKKLQHGSPQGPVKIVQQALFDLSWTYRIDPPFTDEDQFVIGIYGPITTKTVTAYKTYYDLRFPPGDPNGFIDGYAGPTTLAHLDGRVVRLDAATEAIRTKAAALGVELPPMSPPSAWVGDTEGYWMTAVWPDGAEGAIWSEPSAGSHAVCRRIYDRYLELRHAHSHLGFPTSDNYFEDAHGDVEKCDFQGGTITYLIANDQTIVDPPG